MGGVRISELARRADVPVGTVKYYLREGLLPAGTLTSATQAQYDEDHLRRLELIRVLTNVGGLSIASMRDVLAAIDHQPRSRHDLLGTAHTAIGPHPTVSPAALDRATQLLRRWNWPDAEPAPALAQLAAALEGIEAAGITLPDAVLDRYAELMHQVAEVDVGMVPIELPADAIRFVVTGTVLFEPLLLALRKLGHWQASARRFGPDVEDDAE
jgi:DNA-binding transcriptional MerR regulator